MSSVNRQVIDLFSGMGGMSLGFSWAGFDILYALDFEPQAIDIHKLNHPSALHDCLDVHEVRPDRVRERLKIGKGDLYAVLGGPPCQGFSTYGQRDPEDERNFLFERFAAFVDEFRPRFLVMENVIGIMSMEGGWFFGRVVKRFEELGYTCKVMVLNALNFGVPQLRRRVFIVGSRDGERVPFPTPRYRSARRPADAGQFSLFEDMPVAYTQEACEALCQRPSLQPFRTVRDAISDLPEEVFPPSRNNEAMAYPESGAVTEYEALMRKGSDRLWNHSAKRHLVRRLIRTAVITPGEYGKNGHKKVEENGVPDEVRELVAVGKLSEAMFHGARNVDKKAEGELLKKLRAGDLSGEDVEEFLSARGFANKYRRLHWDEPSHTLVAHMARDCSDFIHPEWNRPVSVREAARLQSFPDSFKLAGSQFRQLRFIGNAVPPMLANAVAGVLATL
jgi:DNA (cytosine-5)-methyltransferase 1